MAKVIIEKKSLSFLKKLKKNNNRDWFNKHKDEYTTAQLNIISFANDLLAEMNKHDTIETASGKKSIHRIYRDIRFSKDKIPYNAEWSGGFRRATKKLRGGYYFHIEPGNSFVAGGFWGPETKDLQRFRQDIDYNYPDWRKIFSNKTFKSTFGEMIGEQLSSAPRGYAKDHPAIELLRYKQFLIRHDFTDAEVLSPGFVKKTSDVFKKMRPFLDYTSEVLTTDANGESILD